jgi:GntR family transcriptional repressor for pyruvate dehydrogenase complex
MSRIVREMEQTVAEDDSLKFARFDFQFHKELGKIAKNEVLLMMLDKIQYLIETQQREMFEYDRDSKPLKAAFQDHKDVFEMIRSGNASAASEKMYQHIQHMENRVQSFYASKRDTSK